MLSKEDKENAQGLPESFNRELENGPLQQYRNGATFDWRQMKLYLEGKTSIRFKDHVCKTLASDPLFSRDWRSLSMEESREINFRRWKKIQEYNFVKFGEEGCMDRTLDLLEVLEEYDQGLALRQALSPLIFGGAVKALGTNRHMPVLEQCLNNQIVGSLCLTELSHGSDTNGIRTECHLDKGSFVMNTPDREAIKCWAGNLSHSATHSVVFAQLYTEGLCRGVHAFCMQIRDVSTMKPLEGITIGDMGEKPGDWNKAENGWMRFKSHRFPLSALLNRTADVSQDGKYTTTIKSKRDRQSTLLGGLSAGRVNIIGKAALAARLASIIAIRYSAVRRQFAPQGKEELPILEYPVQQHRVLPMLSTAIALTVFHLSFHNHFNHCLAKLSAGDVSREMTAPQRLNTEHYEAFRHFTTISAGVSSINNEALMSREVHALSCATKAIATSAGVHSLSEARLACGGHGFLKCSRLNELRDSFDPAQTYEGDNNLLLQQSSNVILSILADGQQPQATPLDSFSFMHRSPAAVFKEWHDDIVTDVENAYEWLVVYLAGECGRRMENNMKTGMDRFEARHLAQSGDSQALATTYGELAIISAFHKATLEAPDPLRTVLSNLCAVYALYSLEKHMATLYIGGYCSGGEWGKRMRESLSDAESRLKSDAVSVCDAISPPDFILHSVLGMSDGRVYEHLEKHFNDVTAETPKWCNELSDFLCR